MDLVDTELKKLIPVEPPQAPVAPWEPRPSPRAKAKATSRRSTSAGAAPAKIARTDYPTRALGRKAQALAKAPFSGVPPPMRTRAATRKAAEAASAPSVAALSAPIFPSDQDLRDEYACCDSLSSPPCDSDQYHYHRIAALDIMQEADPEGSLKHMIRGDSYNGLVHINSFSVKHNENGTRTLSHVHN